MTRPYLTISREVYIDKWLRENNDLIVVEELLNCVDEGLISYDDIYSIITRQFSGQTEEPIDEIELRDFLNYELLEDEQFIEEYPEVYKRIIKGN